MKSKVHLKKHMNAKSAFIIVVPFLLVAFQNCGQSVNFASGGAAATTSEKSPASPSNPSSPSSPSNPSQPGQPVSPSLPAPPTGPGITTELQVSLTSVYRAVDIVWTIDNSGSMKDNVAKVKANFDRFISSIDAKANLRLALISSRETSTPNVYGLNLSATGSKYLQINQAVGSDNGLSMAAAAACPKNSSGACGEAQDSFWDYDSYLVSGMLRNFLRPEAKKIFVFVSDDDSFLDDYEFLNAAKQAYPAQAPQVFGFVATSKVSSTPGCTVTDESAEVKSLAVKTGGAAYDICQSDWTSHFDKLISNIVESIDIIVPIPSTWQGQVIDKVVIAGKTIDPKLYKVTQTALILASSLASQVKDGDVVQVTHH